ncbi:MAG: SpoIID/LytB domain-containing protein [Bacteroidales bacterium]|nr:SpoIID/LytB domain-containing protein [Bacteroidales bacterium]
MIKAAGLLSLKLLLTLAVLFVSPPCSAQVKIRIFSKSAPESFIFTAVQGSYLLDHYNGTSVDVPPGKTIIVTRYEGRLAVKSGSSPAWICDSISFRGRTGKDRFSARLHGDKPERREYAGDLSCYPDLGTILMINNTPVGDYIAGVVKAEGGGGRHNEYFKTQSVIARTYMYRHMYKHLQDGYNLCDDVHCQAYFGLTSDPEISAASGLTEGEVIMDADSVLILSAFHSNCGGETAAPENVWLTGQPYLKSIADPHCTNSRNAKWTKTIPLADWTAYLRKSGYTGTLNDPSSLAFVQLTRRSDYSTGKFTVPLRTIRSDFNLRSAFFSVAVADGSVIFRGRGYGHGVGLCQEGAMAMALKGIKYQQIIKFYYTGVIIADVKYAVMPGETDDPPVNSPDEFTESATAGSR